MLVLNRPFIMKRSASLAQAASADKDEEAPKRPLSAYNFFFKAERARLLGKDPDQEDEEDLMRKKQHRKIPGMIGFRELASHVGERWKALSEEERKPYVEMFEQDRIRYKIEMKAWTQKRSESRVAEMKAMKYRKRQHDQSPLSFHTLDRGNQLNFEERLDMRKHTLTESFSKHDPLSATQEKMITMEPRVREPLRSHASHVFHDLAFDTQMQRQLLFTNNRANLKSDESEIPPPLDNSPKLRISPTPCELMTDSRFQLEYHLTLLLGEDIINSFKNL